VVSSLDIKLARDLWHIKGQAIAIQMLNENNSLHANMALCLREPKVIKKP
jgi:hypothetical protein